MKFIESNLNAEVVFDIEHSILPNLLYMYPDAKHIELSAPHCGFDVMCKTTGWEFLKFCETIADKHKISASIFIDVGNSCAEMCVDRLREQTKGIENKAIAEQAWGGSYPKELSAMDNGADYSLNGEKQ